ncbi:MAG: hypothetical protein JRJ21_06095, partial [Deltaproteobacteria bacterium]|nr:hypothetical protein [Deltaproteobacteria bacterium]
LPMPLHHARRAVARVALNAKRVQQQPAIDASREALRAVVARPEILPQAANASQEIRLPVYAKQVARQGHKLPLFIPARPEG